MIIRPIHIDDTAILTRDILVALFTAGFHLGGWERGGGLALSWQNPAPL